MDRKPLPQGADGRRPFDMTPWQRIIALILIGVCAVYLLWRVRGILPPFLIAFFLASLLDPLVSRLQRRGVSRGRAVGSIFLFTFLLVTLAGWMIIPRALHQITDLVQNLSSETQTLTGYSKTLSAKADEWYEQNKANLNSLGVKEKPSEFLSNRTGVLTGAASRALDAIRATVLGFIGQILWLIIIPLSLFYLMMDYPIIRARLVVLIAPNHQASVEKIIRDIVEIFSAYFRSLGIVCLLYGIAATILFSVMGVKWALFLGLAAGVLYAVPYVGPFVAILSTTILSLITPNSVGHTILVVVLLLAMQFAFDYGVTPRLVGGSVGLHPLANIFALMCGATLFGVWGMLLAVPVAASIQMLLLYFFPRLSQPPASTDEPVATRLAEEANASPAPSEPQTAP